MPNFGFVRLMCAALVFFTASACTTSSQPTDSGLIGNVDSGPRRDAGTSRDAFVPRIDSGPVEEDVLIYAHSDTTLFEFSAETNMVREIGVFRFVSGDEAPDMLDLAVDSREDIITVSNEHLYRVNNETAQVEQLFRYRNEDGPRDNLLYALSYLSPDQSPTGSELLIGATNGGIYYSIDLDREELSELGRYGDGWGSSGDIVSVEGLGTFATLRRREGGDDPDRVAQITFRSDGSSSVRIIGTPRQGDTEYEAIFGLGYWGRKLYGFTNAGQLIEIDRDTAVSRLVSDSTGAERFWGAGVTTKVPFLE